MRESEAQHGPECDGVPQQQNGEAQSGWAQTKGASFANERLPLSADEGGCLVEFCLSWPSPSGEGRREVSTGERAVALLRSGVERRGKRGQRYCRAITDTLLGPAHSAQTAIPSSHDGTQPGAHLALQKRRQRKSCAPQHLVCPNCCSLKAETRAGKLLLSSR